MLLLSLVRLHILATNNAMPCCLVNKFSRIIDGPNTTQYNKIKKKTLKKEDKKLQITAILLQIKERLTTKLVWTNC